MTDKIIIDGIDISGCVHLDEWKHCNICKELIKTIPNRYQCLTEQDLRCEYYSNCYYKQLKRLEQENASLKEEIEIRDNLSEKFRKEALSWANIANGYQKDKTKLKQTLQEIKKIAENAYCLTNYTNKDMANFAKQILVTITKAEEE